jgi:hypothetical protein
MEYSKGYKWGKSDREEGAPIDPSYGFSVENGINPSDDPVSYDEFCADYYDGVENVRKTF